MQNSFENKLNIILINKNNFTRIENLKLKFTLSILASELSKLILLALIFNFLGYLNDFMLLTLSLLIFRPHIGGLHFNSYLKCFLITFVFSLTIIAYVTLIVVHFQLKTN